MARLYCYVPEVAARKVRGRAEAAGISTSRYLAELIRRDVESVDFPRYSGTKDKRKSLR